MPATDFDFLLGTWHVANRRLTNLLDPSCEEWEEFEATSEAPAIPRGDGRGAARPARGERERGRLPPRRLRGVLAAAVRAGRRRGADLVVLDRPAGAAGPT